MDNDTVIELHKSENLFNEMLNKGAQQLLAEAIEAEVLAFLSITKRQT